MRSTLVKATTRASTWRYHSLLYTHRAHNGQPYSSIAQHARPFRLAVVGSGPAGFYTAYRVMTLIDGAKIDMYEALPVPFGLVRFGVAPDHPEVKNCQDKFEQVASSPNFTFIGNVAVGTGPAPPHALHVPLQKMMPHYDAILFAYGAAEDRKLAIPGEDLRGVYSARDFVGWYNGLPEFADLRPDLTLGEEAVIIGQGNVALDVARILLEDVNVLRHSDIAEHALVELARSRVKRVRVVGRRGPMQAAFTIKEVRELMRLKDVGFHPVVKSLIPDELKTLPRASRRLMEVLVKGSGIPAESASKSWSADFCQAPTSFVASSDQPDRLKSVQCQRTELSSPFDAQATVKPTDRIEHLPASIAFRSIGYKSNALPDFDTLQIPFDEKRGIIINDGLGRVVQQIRAPDGAMASQAYPGLYCAGWVKRGPTGVIASTMEDAFTTAAAIAHDYHNAATTLAEKQGNQGPRAGWEAIRDDITKDTSHSHAVSWEDWHKIDKVECERGQAKGKPREKFTSTREMLEVVG